MSSMNARLRRYVNVLLVVVIIGLGLLLLGNQVASSSDNPVSEGIVPTGRGPCLRLMTQLSEPDTAAVDIVRTLEEVGVRADVPVPNNLETGGIYCWDAVPEVAGTGNEALHGVAVTDQRGTRVWFVYGPDSEPTVNWREMLHDIVEVEVVETDYGFASHPTSGSDLGNLWERVASRKSE